MQYNECLHSRAEIFTIQKSNNIFIGLVTSAKNVKVFSSERCEVMQNLHFDFLNKKTTAIAFHPTLGIMAIANATTLYIVNLKRKEIIQTIVTHAGTITKLLFLQKSPYLISGTDNGRVMQYRYDGTSHISRLCSFPYTSRGLRKKVTNNYVSAMAYNEEYIACSGYGAALTLIKFNSHTRKITFEVSKTRINAIAFLEQNRVIFGNSDGSLFLAKIRKNAHITEINTTQKSIEQIIVLPKSDFALIVTKENNNILLFDLKKAKVRSYDFLKFDYSIKELVLHNNTLFCRLRDNTIVKVTLTNEQDIITEIKKGELLKAMKLLEANPMLDESQAARELNNLYQKLYSKSFLEFIKTKKSSSLEKLKAFEIIKSKNNDIEDIRKAFVNYEKLQLFFKEHKYALAYALCEKFPALKYTPEYKKMEEYYKRSFTLAQKQLLLQRPQTAKDLLEPFSTVSSKRPMIQLLLKQNKEFLEFLRGINKKDYIKITSLLHTTPIFKEIPSYIALKEQIDNNLKEIKNYIFISKIDEAVEKIKALQKVSIIKDELLELYNLSQEAKKLLNYYEKENFIQCYETLDNNLQLESMQLAQFLEKHWNKLINECEIHALEGNIAALKKTLGELIYVKTRKNKIGDLLRLSFHSKIKEALTHKHYKSVENLIYSYIDIFGIDSEIRQLMYSFEKQSYIKLAITLNRHKSKDRNAWIYSELFDEPTQI